MTDPTIAHLLHQIDHDREEIAAFEQDLIRRPSETGREKDCQDFLAGWLHRAGYEVDVFTPDEVAGGNDFRGRPLTVDYRERPNVVARHKGTGGGRSLLLISHADTVPVGPLENWTVPPYGGEIRNGKIYGRGAQDDKEGIAAQTFALQCIRRLGLRLKGDVILCSAVDEEGGGSMGSWACMARGYRADAGIYCDGLDLKVNPANLGWSGGRIQIQCPPGRMNIDQTKVCADAVYHALHAMRQERRAAFATRALYRDTAWPDENIIIPYFSVGNPEGVAMNEATVMAFMYTLPGNSVHDDRRELEARVRQVWETLGVAAPPPVVEWAYTWPDPYQATGAESILETMQAAGEAATGAPLVVEGGTASDLYSIGLYSQGMPSVCLGPGRFGAPEAAHQPDESISIDDQLIPFVKILAVTMLNWCGWEA
jgi:acetylornithine deacetylase